MSRADSYWKCKYDELITFYPRFYREVFEMDAILRAEGRLADGIDAGIDLIIANNFIDTADEDTLYLLEKFLGLTLLRQRDVEERRRLVKSFFAGQGKVSATRIAEMIYAYTGASTTCEFYPFDEEGNNRLDVIFERGDEDAVYISDIYLLLSKMLPAHIEYRAMVDYKFAVVVGKKRTHYKHAYDLCGTKPETVLIAQIEGIDAVTAPSNTNTVMTYKHSAESGADSKTGVYPQTATLAYNDTIDSATEAAATACGVDYIPCGVTYSGIGG
ncbi:MAG: YmfQ family protein [Oscillospiraceae bacterium]|nr:YmfQ family protein [Oscillospiraceae bacterium]